MDEPQTTEPTEPLDRDLYCLTCGYNLRGLFGDPVRCPECGNLNPIADIEIPAKIIRRQICKMETSPAMCLAMVLLGAVFQVLFWWLLWEGLRWKDPFDRMCAGSTALLAFGPIPGWIYNAWRFRSSCLGKPGWGRALIGYHLWGLLLMVTVLGSLPLLLYLCLETPRRAGVSAPYVPTLLSVTIVVAAFFGIWFWVKWVYRCATAPLMPLQREVAVTLAREEIRKKMMRKPSRWRR